MKLIVFISFIGVRLCAGGMAELKSITGDAPYTGGGNAPAILPQPMGFWGRPQYSGGFPGGFPGGMMGGWHPGMGWLNGDGGRFTSSSGGPYGMRGRIPSTNFPDSSMEGMERESLMLGALTVLGNLLNPSAVPIRSPTRPFPSSSFASRSFNPSTSFSSNSPSNSPSSISLSSATGGGFYKGKGNDFGR